MDIGCKGRKMEMEPISTIHLQIPNFIIREIGKMILKMEKEGLFILMGRLMLAYGQIIRNMDRASLKLLKTIYLFLFMKVHGKRMSSRKEKLHIITWKEIKSVNIQVR
jgi:hypothetical protein